MIALIRRRQTAQAAVDEYEGFVLGQLQTSPYVATEMVLALTPLLEIPPTCQKIRAYTYGSYTAGCRGVILKEDKTYLMQGNATSANGQIYMANFANTAKYFQMTLNVDRIDDCWVLDETNNVYILKGKNVGGGKHLIINALCGYPAERSAA